MPIYSYIQVLLVSSMGGRGWIIPGGKVEPFEVDNPSVSAIREAREEGGVRGCLLKCRLISFTLSCSYRPTGQIFGGI